MRHKLISFGAVTAAALILSSCGGGGTGAAAGGNGIAVNAEPTGGDWQPVVIPSAGSINFPTFPAQGSAEDTAELTEIKTLQMGRSRQILDDVRFWNAGASIRWNEIARQLVIKYKTNPPMAARMYALLSVAQYDALIATWKAKYQYKRAFPTQRDSQIRAFVELPRDFGFPCDHSAVATASAAVLNYVYPAETDFLAGKAAAHQESRMIAGVSSRSDVNAGVAIGNAVSAQVISHASADHSGDPWTGTIPTGEGIWFSSANPPAPPLLPAWGAVTPWLVQDVAALRPPAPPAFNSTEFQEALAEIRDLSDNRTDEQLRIAQFWADGGGTVTPPGHWNQILCDMMLAKRTNEIRAARALALINMAMMDAGICCWDAKYAYWLIRPSQADPAITLPVGLPNFPSYTSGHSTFSGAAAEVIAYIFPEEAASARGMALEAALSRMYGGIHYRFDSEVGLETGKSIGQLAINRGKADGSPQ